MLRNKKTVIIVYYVNQRACTLI